MSVYQAEKMNQEQSEALEEAVLVLESAASTAEDHDDPEDATMFWQTARMLKEAFSVGR